MPAKTSSLQDCAGDVDSLVTESQQQLLTFVSVATDGWSNFFRRIEVRKGVTLDCPVRRGL